MLTVIVQSTVGAVLFAAWVYFVAVGRAELGPLISFISTVLTALAYHVTRRDPQP